MRFSAEADSVRVGFSPSDLFAPCILANGMKQDLEDTSKRTPALESDQELFATRHLGPDAAESVAMLQSLGVGTIDDLIDRVVPPGIRSSRSLQIGPGRSEHAILREMREFARTNEIYRSYIGMGYYDCITPPVVQRNILEDPGWYTQYTPYQPEIAQGRLEALLNFQTMVSDLTAMEVANASLLDEGTAAAEAMGMSYAACRQKKKSSSSRPAVTHKRSMWYGRGPGRSGSMSWLQTIARLRSTRSTSVPFCNTLLPMALSTTCARLSNGRTTRTCWSRSLRICLASPC